MQRNLIIKQVNFVTVALSNPWDREIEINSLSVFAKAPAVMLSYPCSLVMAPLSQVSNSC